MFCHKLLISMSYEILKTIIFITILKEYSILSSLIIISLCKKHKLNASDFQLHAIIIQCSGL